MKNVKIDFKEAITAVLDSKRIEEEAIAASTLINSYNKLCDVLFFDDSLKKNKETIVKGGIALSSKHAKDCLKDPIRTARFLKGIYKALLVVKERFKNEKITILYAGCGPLGTLIIPLLHLFSTQEIEVILLDIHQTSIDLIKKIVKKLKFETYIKEYIVADATRYKHPKENQLQMIVTEAMDKALTKEPQIEITRNLGNQLANNGIFIPKKIEIQRGYSFFAEEFVFNLKDDVYKLFHKNYSAENCNTEKLFSITRKIEPSNSFNFETNWISIPANFEKTPDICLYTSVQIFDDIHLKTSESFITNPYCVKSLYSIKNKMYKLKYSTSHIPNWKLIEK